MCTIRVMTILGNLLKLEDETSFENFQKSLDIWIHYILQKQSQ